MSISSCPKCSAQVSLPQGVPASSQVRCPLCHAEYALHEALVNAPPMLLLINDGIDRHPDDDVVAATTVGHIVVGAIGGAQGAADASPLQTLDLHLQDAPVDTDLPEIDTELEELHFGADHDSTHADNMDDDEIGLADEHHDAFHLDGEAVGVSAAARTATADETAVPVLKPSSRVRKREPSMIANLIGVIGGGILGCSLGYYIVLLIGGPSKDFLDLGPNLKWILPASFSKPAEPTKPGNPGPKLTAQGDGQSNSQGNGLPSKGAEQSTDTSVSSATDPDEESPVETPLTTFDNPSSETAGPAADESMPDDSISDEPVANADVPTVDPADDLASDEMPDTDESASTKTKTTAIPAEMPDDSAETATNSIDDEPDSATTASDETASDDTATDETMPDEAGSNVAASNKPVPDEAILDEAAPDELTPDETAEPIEPAATVREAKAGPREPNKYDVAKVDAAIKSLVALSTKLDEADKLDKDQAKKLKMQFYYKCYDLAQVASFSAAGGAPAEVAVQREAIENIAREIVADPKKAAEIGIAAGQWLALDPAKRNGRKGVLLTGTVQDVAKHGNLYDARIALTGSKKVVSLLSAEQPAFKPQDKTVVLGSIVADPTQELIGYEGAGGPVVWAELSVKMP